MAQNDDQATARIFDLKTKTLRSIPARELAAGMAQVRLVDSEEAVWVETKQALTLPTWWHPPLGLQALAKITQIKELLDDVYPKTLWEWEATLRRECQPDQEIEIWLRVGQTYQAAIRTLAFPKDAKWEVYNLVVTCSFAPRDQVHLVTDRQFLSKEMAKRVIDLYFDR